MISRCSDAPIEVGSWRTIADEFSKVVTPVKTGVQGLCKALKRLDSGFRRNDEKRVLSTFYELIILAE